MEKKIELTVVLPVHNEGKTIEKVVNRLIKSLDDIKISYEILCIENGSTDDSYRKLVGLSKKRKEVKVYVSNKGWGNAVKKGIQKAKGKYFCYMVSDDQVDPKCVGMVFNFLKENKVDLVKVRRKNRENFTRFINSRIYNFLSSVLFGFSGDINATPKVLKTEDIRKLHLESDNIAIDLELLLKLKRRHGKWKNIPIISKRRSSGSSTTNLKSVIEMFTNMLKLLLYS